MLSVYQFQTADRIIAGANTLSQLKEHLHAIHPHIQRALIVTQPTVRRRGFSGVIEQQLTEKGIAFDVCTAILPEPTVQNIEETFAAYSGNRYEIIIGLGGGSVLDAAKILSVLMTNEQKIADMLGTNAVAKPGVATVLIPTTSGTGSEVTPNAIVTFPDQELKIGIVSPYLLPKLVILDPVLTLGLPKPITAATGMDAFTHALESFISNKANYFSDMFALESIRLISASIVEAYENGSSIEAREKMLLGSTYGGMALTAAGTAAVHALAYPLGGKYGIPHGVANSMLLPSVMEFNMDHCVDRLNLVAGPMAIETAGLTPEEVAQRVIAKIREWTEKLNIPQDLTAYGVQEENVEALAQSASQVTRLLNNNPKVLSLDDMKMIYRNLIVK
ncbi:Alcohol dehydrogenase, class IV [Paenibacillus algorifonticola]|uniref:Alcohol dehydrogenase, class IV n=1 Tax=Paenibacillus algorifonticola TaxID=684063 RepID=A0A1I1YMJ6_9BACL|nr:iron-containing alcohol dehydrogenase [Paenibacillus algorifonticola]SFE20815.1 Alcohol dehydrogenase, class IV [Paenibacillus algorifonticola]